MLPSEKSVFQKFVSFIKQNKLILPNDKIILALSGGSDYVFFFRMLLYLQKDIYFLFVGCHINHQLRGEDSDGDEKFCSSLCSKNQIDFLTEKINVIEFASENKLSIEEAARELRYNKLSAFKERLNFNKIATAHNIDDNAETVLLNLFKGAGLNGLSGIPIIRESIIRPVITFSKNEITEFLSKIKQDFRTDLSNFENDYQRNFIRNKIFPLLKEINPKLSTAVFRNSQIIRNTSISFEYLIKKFSNEFIDFNDNILSINLLPEFENKIAIILDSARIAMNERFSYSFTFRDYEKFSELFFKQKGSSIKLRNNFIVLKEQNKLMVFKQSKNGEVCSQEAKISLDGESIYFDGFQIKTELLSFSPEFKNQGNHSEFISANKLDNIFIF